MSNLINITETEVSEDGEIPAGFLFASVKNLGDQIVTVNGQELPPGEAKSYPFAGKGIQAIPYLVNGSKLLIMYYQ